MDSVELTYGQMETQVHQLAFDLRHYGVRPGTFVGLILERSLETVIRAGGAYVPMDLSWPENRIECDCGCSV